ncbi:MAG: hypothetical protein F6K41_24245 [Symploca sp. SIO3E6]|nr:hypothetical protein [Caldora sp. SIO3E6]
MEFYPIPNSQFPIPNSQFPIPNSQFPIPNSQFPILHFLVEICEDYLIRDRTSVWLWYVE